MNLKLTVTSFLKELSYTPQNYMQQNVDFINIYYFYSIYFFSMASKDQTQV